MATGDALQPVLDGIRESLELVASGSFRAQKRLLAFMAAQAAAEEGAEKLVVGEMRMG